MDSFVYSCTADVLREELPVFLQVAPEIFVGARSVPPPLRPKKGVAVWFETCRLHPLPAGGTRVLFQAVYIYTFCRVSKQCMSHIYYFFRYTCLLLWE
jgi:hypothetical protein